MNSIVKAVGVSLGGLVMGASLFVGFVYGIVIATVDDDPQLDWEDDQS